MPTPRVGPPCDLNSHTPAFIPPGFFFDRNFLENDCREAQFPPTASAPAQDRQSQSTDHAATGELVRRSDVHERSNARRRNRQRNSTALSETSVKQSRLPPWSIVDTLLVLGLLIVIALGLAA